MTNHRLIVFGLGLFVASFVVSVRPAFAREGKDSGSKKEGGAAKKEQAEVHYDQGKAYYRAGAFDLAIQEFLEGYKLDPRAGVLFNIARGYEELKNRDKAIEFYKKYVDQGPQATAATEARARLVVLERQIKDEDERKKAETAEAERKRHEAIAPPPALPMPAPVETKPPASGVAESTPAGSSSGATFGSTAVPTSADANVTSTAPPGSDSGHTMKTAGLVVGGAGVVLAGVGGFFAYRASSIKSDIGNEKSYSPGKDSDYHTAGTMAVVGFIGGAVAIAGGAALYVLGSNKEHAEAATPTVTARLSPVVSPVLGPDGAALLLSGRF